MTMRATAIVLAIAAATGLTFSFGGGFAASLNASSQALTPYRTCTITATPSSTTAVADAGVQQASPTSNFGSSTTSDVTSAKDANGRLYIRFDLGACQPAIPASAIVRLATLRLYLSSRPANCRTLDIFRVTASWTESGITWNNQPFGTAIDNPPSSSRIDSFDAGTAGSCENRTAGYVSGAIVTGDVAAFVAGTAANRGWMLRDDSEDSNGTRTSTFSAKELGTLAQAPQLVVTYVSAP